MTSGLGQVPAEVDLRAGDPVLLVEGNDLGVPSPAATGHIAFVGDDDLVAGLDQPDELEVLASPRARPATVEVTVSVELRVWRGGEEKVIAEALIEEAAVPGCECGIGVANDLLAVGDQPILARSCRVRRLLDQALAQSDRDRVGSISCLEPSEDVLGVGAHSLL